MSWIITGQEAGSLKLLDQYGGAAAAYSLRNLSLYYTDPVVRVRRDNDDAEQDFTATEVSDGTLAAWVGAGNDGFVRIWYDQSGNENDAEQATAASQPKIVDSGTLVKENGKAALDFDGSNDWLNTAANFSNNDVNISAFVTALSKNVTSDGYLYDNSNNVIYGGGYTHRFLSSGGFRIWAQDAFTAIVDGGSTVNNTLYLTSRVSTNAGGETNTLFQNGVQTGTATGAPSARGAKSTTNIGRSELFSGYLNGLILELIAYPSDQSTSRAAIEANINAHYNIF